MDVLSRRISTVLTALVSITVLSACSTSPASSDPPTEGAQRTVSVQDRADIDAVLSQAAENAGLTDPPQVDIVRVVSAADYPSTQVECLHAAGFTGVALTPDGSGVTVELPSGDQLDAYDVASYTCMAQYPKDPAQDESRMTHDQKIVVYTYVTQTLVECLETKGFTISGIPSEATFLAAWDTGAWNPYEQLASVDTRGVESECLRDTPPDLVWGD